MRKPQTIPVRFEQRNGYAVFRGAGRVRLDEAIDIMDAVLAAARDQHPGNLLADIAGFSGFASPNLAERYFFVHRRAKTAAGAVRLVVVTQPEMIDPEKFGVKVAGNLGFPCEVFATEAEAIAWLTGPGAF